MQSLSKYQWYFSENQKKIISKFVWKHKGSKNAKTNLRKNRSGGIMPRDLGLYYKTTVIKTVWHKKNRNTDQRNKIKSPEINPFTNGHLIFDKGGTNI